MSPRRRGGKAVPAPANLPRLLTLQRGHWFEQGVAESLAGLGIHALTQLEIRCEQGEMPLVAHCDLVLVWQQPRPAVRILEIERFNFEKDETRGGGTAPPGQK